jgi:hypothetical protein
MELDAMPDFNKFLQNSTQKFTVILQGTMARDYNSVYVVWFDRPVRRESGRYSYIFFNSAFNFILN